MVQGFRQQECWWWMIKQSFYRKLGSTSIIKTEFPQVKLKNYNAKIHRPVTGAALCSMTGVIVLWQWCWWTAVHVRQPIILVCWRTRLIYGHHPRCFRLFPHLQHLSEKGQVGSCCAHPQPPCYTMKQTQPYKIILGQTSTGIS